MINLLTIIRKHRLIALLCLALSGTCISVIAQTEDNGERRDEQTTDAKRHDGEQEQAQREEENAPSLGADSPDTFVPSEEISEDLSVSFPVDI